MKKNQLKGLPFLALSEREEQPEKEFDPNRTQPLQYITEAQKKEQETVSK